jgi:hypothetical protein
MRILFITTVNLIAFSSCHGQSPKVGGFSNYQVGSIDSLDSFMRFTSVEKQTDSIYKEGDKQIDSLQREVESKITNKNSDTAKFLTYAFAGLINDFSSNRARLFISAVRNNEAEVGDPMAAEGLPAVCKCIQDKDSITVEFAFGFGGGIAVKQKMVGLTFRTNVTVVTRHADIYKASLSDKTFKSELTLEPMTENMTLLTRPSMQIGEQLTGFVTVQSRPYFVKASGGKIDTASTNVRYFFTCKTRKKPAAPNSGFMQ